MAHGGKREGAGRPKLLEAHKAQKLCQKAIIAKYGSLEKGIKDIMDYGDPSLKKFIWQHAIGAPPQKVVNSFSDNPDDQIQSIKVEVIRTQYNREVDASAGTNDDSK